jgi:benzoate membrane transport protein
VLAPFGAFALNFSAITAAICMGPEAHEDPAGATPPPCPAVRSILPSACLARWSRAADGFPKELVVAIAGLALLGTIGNGLATALRDEPHREAALITFLVTLSGVVIGEARRSGAWWPAAGAVCATVRRRNAPRKH